MNDHNEINGEMLNYQTMRLRDIIAEIVQCCDDRKLYESRKFGLPYSELKCLMLFLGERYLTVKGIAEKLDVAKSRVTTILDRLIEKRFAERIVDPKDARIKLISLTPKGKKKAEQLKDHQRKIHGRLLLEMNNEERKNVLSHLELLRTAMEAVKEQMV
ncbi:MAG: MarR family transcriptional regulator [Desulfobacteraceae bacterium]|nr:MarR family transcriptional regulator [Desulfobacteraceae bacterium]